MNIDEQHSRAKAAADAQDWDRADLLYGDLLPVLRRELGEDHPQVLDALERWTDVAGSLDDHERATALLEQAVELASRIEGVGAKRTVDLTTFLALLWGMAGRVQEARDILEKQLALHDGPDGPEWPGARLECVRMLGTVEGAYGDRVEYLRWRRRDLELHRAEFGSTDDRTVRAARALVSGLRKEGGHDEATKIFRATLSEIQRAEERPSEDVIEALLEEGHNLVSYLAGESFDVACQLYADISEAAERLLPGTDAFAGSSLVTLGCHALIDHDDLDQASRYFQQWSDLQQETFEATNKDDRPSADEVGRAEAMVQEATEMRDHGQDGEAAEVLEEATRIVASARGPADAWLVRPMHLLAACRLDSSVEDEDLAEERIEGAWIAATTGLAIALGQSGVDPELAALCANEIGILSERGGNYQEARHAYGAAVTLMKQSPSPDPDDLETYEWNYDGILEYLEE